MARPLVDTLPERAAKAACFVALVSIIAMLPTAAHAAEFDGSSLKAWWGIPFAGVLLSIAVLPLVMPHVWHHHYGKIVAAWALAFFIPFAVIFGPGVAVDGFLHALVAEYIPFILLVGSLYVIAGGIFLRGNLHGSPALNTGHPGNRFGDGQHHGHDRRIDAADPAVDPRQRQPQKRRSRRRLLHLHGIERRRLA